MYGNLCALKRECITHFGLKRNFFFEFLQVFAAQCELYLWELDGDFNSIHVRMMHDACEGSSVIEWRVKAASSYEASRQQIPDFATYRNRLLAAASSK
jgi:hypothetical protein